MPELLGRLQSALADRYRLDREVGAGGMATVYLAQDIRHDRRVALKVLRPELAAVIGAERFLAEIKLTANLQHPHILPLFDSGEADGYLFYVMPFVEGESLRDRLNREKQLPVADAVRIATEVASALDYAHRHGVVHRDIKPENILLHDGQALVADFGIALAASKAGGSRMTETGMRLGTPYYMSPEQAMGEREITGRSDVYALGAVLYEMLTGDPPFTGSTAQAIVARVVTESPRPLHAQRHTIPPHVEAAVLTALEKLPADRFGTAAEFAEALAGRGARRHHRGDGGAAAAAALRRRRRAGAAVEVGRSARRSWPWPPAPRRLGVDPAQARAGGHPLQPSAPPERGAPPVGHAGNHRHLSRRQPDRLHRRGRRRHPALAPGARQAPPDADRGHRERGEPVLLAGREPGRLHRQRAHAAGGPAQRRPTGHAHRQPQRLGRRLGRRRLHLYRAAGGLGRIRATGGPIEVLFRLSDAEARDRCGVSQRDARREGAGLPPPARGPAGQRLRDHGDGGARTARRAR